MASLFTLIFPPSSGVCVEGGVGDVARDHICTFFFLVASCVCVLIAALSPLLVFVHHTHTPHTHTPSLYGFFFLSFFVVVCVFDGCFCFGGGDEPCVAKHSFVLLLMMVVLTLLMVLVLPACLACLSCLLVSKQVSKQASKVSNQSSPSINQPIKHLALCCRCLSSPVFLLFFLFLSFFFFLSLSESCCCRC